MTRYLPLIFTLIFSGMAFGAGAEATRQDKRPDGFTDRVDAMFRADSGKPLVRAAKKPPLRAGSGDFTRAYSDSMVWFAARCFYLNEQLDEANAALVENAQYYIDHPLDIIDRDSFHWHADIVMRLIEMYGTNGTARAGLLTPQTEAQCLKPIWIYVKDSAKHNKANHVESKTWHFLSTENHHAMDFTVQWHFAKLAKDRPEYRDQTLDDGTSLAEHYRSWNDYIVVYCRERAMKGTNIEIMCPGYNSVWLKGFYNFRDFGEPKVRHAAEMLIDLYWAYWAEEQLNGVAGGGKTRIRGVHGFSGRSAPALGWMYFGIGEQPAKSGGEINGLLSDYQPPDVVAEIARSALKDGPYEIRQRAQGLGKGGNSPSVLEEGSEPSGFRTDGGGIVRYTYCHPAFIIGTLMHEARPSDDWVAISSQSRWQGVIFGDAPGARIVPVVRPAGKAKDVINGHWSVQCKGSLITQKLKNNAKVAKVGPMIVWISKEGMGEPVREGEWVFVETAGACAVIRVVGSDFKITNDTVSTPSKEGSVRVAPPGWSVVPSNDFAPVIVEVMAKTDIQSLDGLKSKAKGCKISFDGPVLHYTSVYGDELTFDTSYKKTPTINGKPVDYAPKKVFDSPFLNADYNSGIVTISKGEKKCVLDFNKGDKKSLLP